MAKQLKVEVSAVERERGKKYTGEVEIDGQRFLYDVEFARSIASVNRLSARSVTSDYANRFIARTKLQVRDEKGRPVNTDDYSKALLVCFAMDTASRIDPMDGLGSLLKDVLGDTLTIEPPATVLTYRIDETENLRKFLDVSRTRRLR